MNIIDFIPQSLRQKAIDATVDFVVDFGKGYLKDEIVKKIKKLRSDGAFQDNFEKGLQRAADRFSKEYIDEDEDLVEAISANDGFFNDREIQEALLSILKKPGIYLNTEQEAITKSFDSVLPNRRNRQRVNNAVHFFLKCLAEEVWELPELRPIYEFHFQRITAEALSEQIVLQKAQLETNGAISADIRDALLQLTGAIAEQKAITSGEESKMYSAKILHNLPQPDHEQFIGRETELDKIYSLLSPQSRHFVITIDGIGGIGKSALALNVANTYRCQFETLTEEERFEAIIWTTAKQTILTGEGIITRPQSIQVLEDIYTTIAVTLDREDILRSPKDEQDDLVCQALTQQRTLLIIDNLETIDDERVLTFIREVPAPTKIIVTTRHRLDIAYPVRLVAMSEQDSTQLINNTAKQKEVTLSEEDGKQLHSRTGGVPLAVVWSIAQMSFGYGVEAVLERLGQPTSDIAKFCFEASLEEIEGKPAHKLVLALSLFVTDASREALGYVTNLSELDRDDGLVTLEKLSLIHRESGRFSLLTLTQRYISEQFDPSDNSYELTISRMVEFYQQLTKGYGYARSTRAFSSLYKEIKLELANIMSIIDWCYDTDKIEDATSIWKYINYPAWILGYWEAIINYERMSYNAYKKLGDTRRIARSAMTLSWILHQREEFEEAKSFAVEAYSIAESLNDKKMLGFSLRNLGVIHVRWNKKKEAQKYLEQAYKISVEVKDDGLQGRLYYEIGNLAFLNEHFEEAKKLYEKSLTIDQQRHQRGDTSSLVGEIVLCIGLGKVALKQQELGSSRDFFLRALNLLKEEPVREEIGKCKKGLAEVELKFGNIELARQFVDAAIEEFTKLGMKHELKEAQALVEQISQVTLIAN